VILDLEMIGVVKHTLIILFEFNALWPFKFIV